MVYYSTIYMLFWGEINGYFVFLDPLHHAWKTLFMQFLKHFVTYPLLTQVDICGLLCLQPQ